jgi:hypothetical protein
VAGRVRREAGHHIKPARVRPAAPSAAAAAATTAVCLSVAWGAGSGGCVWGAAARPRAVRGRQERLRRAAAGAARAPVGAGAGAKFGGDTVGGGGGGGGPAPRLLAGRARRGARGGRAAAAAGGVGVGARRWRSGAGGIQREGQGRWRVLRGPDAGRRRRVRRAGGRLPSLEVLHNGIAGVATRCGGCQRRGLFWWPGGGRARAARRGARRGVLWEARPVAGRAALWRRGRRASLGPGGGGAGENRRPFPPFGVAAWVGGQPRWAAARGARVRGAVLERERVGGAPGAVSHRGVGPGLGSGAGAGSSYPRGDAAGTQAGGGRDRRARARGAERGTGARGGGARGRGNLWGGVAARGAGGARRRRRAVSTASGRGVRPRIFLGERGVCIRWDDGALSKRHTTRGDGERGHGGPRGERGPPRAAGRVPRGARGLQAGRARPLPGGAHAGLGGATSKGRTVGPPRQAGLFVSKRRAAKKLLGLRGRRQPSPRGRRAPAAPRRPHRQPGGRGARRQPRRAAPPSGVRAGAQ